MITEQQITDVIYSVIDQMNELRDQNLIDKGLQTPLIGQRSQLDSVDLVNLLLGVEEQLEDEFDISFVVANEKALSLKNSPFRTVKTLTDYLTDSINQ
ncbi:hypothetical protein [Gayadomonas joobiniege]|uniref:hypothetical protein n=1 Tax=Gayadomonas joobiniege TaxID=1234606 RepID=UPI00035F9328|nr:hypothetical protein [Gayadomonas joobiniege]